LRASLKIQAAQSEFAIWLVMPGLVPGIHGLCRTAQKKTWMAATSPAMTKESLSGG
jgi:hypothetical protein